MEAFNLERDFGKERLNIKSMFQRITDIEESRAAFLRSEGINLAEDLVKARMYWESCKGDDAKELSVLQTTLFEIFKQRTRNEIPPTELIRGVPPNGPRYGAVSLYPSDAEDKPILYHYKRVYRGGEAEAKTGVV